MDTIKNNQNESPPNHVTVDKEGNWWLPDGTMSVHSPNAPIDRFVNNCLKSIFSGKVKRVQFRR